MKSTDKTLSNHLVSYLGIAVFLVAVVFRGLVGWSLADNLDADPDAYVAISQSIERTGVYGLVDDQGIARPTAFRPPLYPWLLSLVSVGSEGQRVGVLVFHTLLGGWTVLATFLISRRYVSLSASFLAAALVMLDPILLMQSTLVMTETLATALSAAVFWWCAKRTSHVLYAPTGSIEPKRGKDEREEFSPHIGSPLNYKVGEFNTTQSVTWSIGLGLLLTLSYLCRPTFLVWAVLLVFALVCVSLCQHRLANWRSNLVPPAIAILIVVAGVGAWTVRNSIVIGHPVWATTHGGYTLLLGNNSMFYQHLQTSKPGQVWDAGPFLVAYQNRYHGDVSDVTEYSDDRRAYEEAKATIASQPRMFVYSCFVRLARLWAPMPHQIEGRSNLMKFGVGLFYVVTFLMSLVGLFKLRRRLFDRFVLASLTLALTLSLVHSVYWSNMRMRAPLTPAMAVLAAVGCFRREPLPMLGSPEFSGG